MLTITFRPLEIWPGEQTRHRRDATFRCGYSDTVDLLVRELQQLGAKSVVLQVAVSPREIRNDGMLYAKAKPTHPGVVINFESRGLPMQFACDRYRDWQHNLRAIALTLEALRAVDRWGATKEREQYRGWAQLPPGEGYVPPAPPPMTAADAAVFLSRHSPFKAEAIAANAEVRDRAYRDAVKRLHPDVGGTHEDFVRLQQAAAALGRAA